jgi:hypothetical protein
MTMTNYSENLVLVWLLAAPTAAPTRPTLFYIGLFTATPSDTGGGTEVSGNAYARQAATFAVSGTTPTQAANLTLIEYPAATPATWGTISHAALFDAVTAGNMLWYGALTASVTINANDIFRWAIGAFKLNLD